MHSRGGGGSRGGGRSRSFLELALASGFVEKDGGGAADVEGIDLWRHRDGDGFITHGQHGRGNTLAFAAENDAAVAGQVGLRQGPAGPVGLGWRATNAPG